MDGVIISVHAEQTPVRLRLFQPADASAVTGLIHDYLTWAAERLYALYGVEEMPTDVNAIGRSLSAFELPAGLLLVAQLDKKLVGVGAIRTIAPGVAEIKRMYVTPEVRGHHAGSTLLDCLIEHARETFHAKIVRLDTCGFMADAQRMYASRGFQERTPYEGTEIPSHLQQYWRFFEREL
ncbi:N-acetylglutamate synthase-like GNAT family acetyltransferase [Streptomyces sp. LBL]|uniref:GNAT family N-acetyltransferase n=1 Tax=Streptomyces sp. LBL TaxID=2940562 RepID=UPI0024740718|nr:GNAT family N-acetyltransferase [Streptomyces sp. LBL]MDH6630416.1 N-acetylglutamate synthase-like GNAT family acetyltransferase [Streptomyces sp. LBL]